MDHEQERLVEIFNEARAKGSAEEREAYLAGACGNDAALRRQVEVLLQADTQMGDFLKPPADDPPEHERPSAVIGHYKLLEQIGEGGFGVVYMAEQLEPIRRRVALKIIKPGMDTRQVIARFEAERQALALMDHPNIAHVFDAGATETGRPYFVMELVQGVPITHFCDANDLTAEERLKLFQNVCAAVQHAHQKGVIHRDLKPSNIMVTLHDGKPVPKVIDFGTAKALQQPLTEKTLFTAYGKLLGTPQYMSPEQAELSGLDVDTRADIYSLGVLLYELLTGTTPFEAERLRSAAFDEMMRMIRQEDPPKPSTRVSTLGERATEIAKHRQVDANLLQRSLRGDLDWIVMKALEKDRARRYETANALTEDLQRHLDHQPVHASPPGAVYRARKFVQRHRMGVALAASVAVALIAGLVASLVGFSQARRERDRAQEETAIAGAVNKFLQQDLLYQASPWSQPDRDVKLRTLLDRASENVGTRFQGKPMVEAGIRRTLFMTYLTLNEHSNARVHLDRVLEIYQERRPRDDPKLLSVQRRAADLLRCEGRSRESELLLKQLLAYYHSAFGPTNEDALDIMEALAKIYCDEGRLTEGQDLIEEVLEVRRQALGPEQQLAPPHSEGLAHLYSSQGKLAEAQKLQEEIMAYRRRVEGPEHPKTLRAMHNLADTYQAQGKLDEAQKLCEEVLAVRRRVLGPEHLNTLVSMSQLASVYNDQGKMAEAQKLKEQALSVSRRVLGADHRFTLKAAVSLAWQYCERGRHAESQKLLEKALPSISQVFGPEHSVTMWAKQNLAVTYARQNKLAEAQQLDAEVLEVRRRVLSEEHPDTLAIMHNLAYHYSRQGKPAEAKKLLAEVLAIQRRVLGLEHPDTVATMNVLAWACRVQKKFAEAQKLCEEALAIQRRILGLEHPDTVATMNELAWMLATCGDPKVRDGQGAVRLAEEMAAATSRTNANYLDTLAAAYAEVGQFTNAVSVQQEAIALLPEGKGRKGYESRLRHYQSGTTDWK